MTPISLSDDKTFAWWLRAIHQLGFPIVVAGILLYVVLSGVMQDVQATRADIIATRADLVQHVRAAETLAITTDQRTNALTRIMQQICVNTAANNDERRGCFPP
jgi:hypothetical protein